MQPVSNLKWYIVIVILVAVLVPSLTWNILTATSKKSPFSSKPNAGANSSFFDFHNSGVTGKIVKAEGNKLWIENQRGETMEAKFSSILSGPQGIPSEVNTTPTFELNKPATINFNFVNGEFEIISVVYIQDPTTPANGMAAPAASPQNPTSSGSSPVPAGSLQPLKLERPMGIPGDSPTEDSDESDNKPSPSP